MGGSGSYSKGVTNTKQTMIDINGDGKPDVVQKNGLYLEIYLNTGNGFSSKCNKIFVGKDFVLNEESSTSNSGSGNVYGGAGVHEANAHVFGGMFGWKDCGFMWKNMMHVKDAAEKNPEYIAEAKAFGKKFV